MLLNIFFILAIVSIFSFHSAFSETYEFIMDEKSFNIQYEGLAEVLAMKIDHESKSLLIGIRNVEDSNFKITFPDEIISAKSNEFAVLVNGYEVSYSLEKKDDNTILSFFVPYGSQEIEIIGTRVIPEFPLGSIIAFSLVTLSSIIISKTKHVIRL